MRNRLSWVVWAGCLANQEGAGKTFFTVRAYDTLELAQRRLVTTNTLQISSGIGIEF